MKRRFTWIQRRRWIRRGLLLALSWPLAQSAWAADIPQDVLDVLQQLGSTRVILDLAVPWQPEGDLDERTVTTQRLAIAQKQTEFVETVNQELFDSGVIDSAHGADGQPMIPAKVKFQTTPQLVMEVNSITLPVIAQNALTAQIKLDAWDEPQLTQSMPLIGADKAQAQGYTAKGQMIAVLDTGVDKAHPFFATNRVVAEACFSATLCPNGKTVDTQVNSALPCTFDSQHCNHGTHVAGIAASVAKEAQMIPVQVFSNFSGVARSAQSDQIAALEWVYLTYGKVGTPLAAVNLSVGGGKFAAACDTDSRTMMIRNLKSVGVATVVSSGNDGFTDGISAPACISAAVSVGATDKSDNVASFSNSANILDLLAPGVDIVSALPGGGTGAMNGTSMAAPFVAGAWAVLKAAKPTATVDELLTMLQSTGKQVTGKGVTKPRIQLDAALATPVVAATGCDVLNKDGLVLCLPFNGNANDASENGNNGTVNGATLTTDRFGNANSAYQFDGKDDFILVPDSPTLNPTHLTISVWVNSAHWHLGYVIDKDDGRYARQYIISAYQNFHAHQRTIDGGFIHYSNAGLSYGKWYHVVQTYDGQSLKLYIDGQYNPPASNSTTATSSGPGDNKVSQQPLRIGIGTLDGTPYFPFVGVIDDISIYNRALSDAEVQQLYAFSKKVTLFVAKTGNGQVTGNGVTCGTDCIDYLIPNAQATLTATANTGSSFTGWTGDCTGTNATVTVTMDKEKTCKANFELLPSYVATSGQGVNGCDVVKDGLVACYPFDSNANDTSGNGNNGTVNGAILTTDRFGNANSAYQFDGKDDFIVVPDSPTLNPTHLTISLWVNAPSGNGYIIAKDRTYSRQYAITVSYGAGVGGLQRTIDDGFTHYGAAIGLNSGWNHIVQTYDGQSLKLYINGQYGPPKDGSAYGPGPGNTASNEPVRIGATFYDGQPYAPVVGVIDDIGIYNRALSEGEIRQLYAIGTKVTLTVAKTGNGQVTGNGITCGTDCTEDLAPNTAVTLTATAATGSIFKQWTGDCTGTAAAVTVTMDKAKTCAATFEPLPPTTPPALTIQKTGNGSGTVKGTDPNKQLVIDCGKDCVAEGLTAGTQIALAAYNIKGSIFTGWSGNCSGTAPKITVTIDKATTCVANFDLQIPPPIGMFTLTIQVTGAGTVTTTGIDCGTDCQGNYAAGKLVWLTATPATNAKLIGWSGACSGTKTVTSVTLDANKTCTAEFSGQQLPAAAQEIITAFYAKATLAGGGLPESRYPQAKNEQRLWEAFRYAEIAVIQADQHLGLLNNTWPHQFDGIDWYATAPVGQYTQTVKLMAGQYVEVVVNLQTADGQEEAVSLWIFYGEQPDAGNSMTPIRVALFPRWAFTAWWKL